MAVKRTKRHRSLISPALPTDQNRDLNINSLPFGASDNFGKRVVEAGPIPMIRLPVHTSANMPMQYNYPDQPYQYHPENYYHYNQMYPSTQPALLKYDPSGMFSQTEMETFESFLGSLSVSQATQFIHSVSQDMAYQHSRGGQTMVGMGSDHSIEESAGRGQAKRKLDRFPLIAPSLPVSLPSSTSSTFSGSQVITPTTNHPRHISSFSSLPPPPAPPPAMTKPATDPDTKRAHHIAAEHKRRFRIRSELMRLHDLLPPSHRSSSKVSQSQVLQSAADFMESLLDANKRMRREIVELKGEIWDSEEDASERARGDLVEVDENETEDNVEIDEA